MFEIYLYSDIKSYKTMVVVRFHTDKFFTDSVGKKKEITISECKHIYRYDFFFNYRYRRIAMKLMKKILKRKEIQKYLFQYKGL